jgi:LmbE family N-acetylglucosaminyl deacetylase
MKRILVVAAHPDDEVLGCGASMAKWADAGAEIHVAILGEGATSRHASREEASAGELETLRSDARSAAVILGVRNVTFHGLPDNRFDSLPLLDVVKEVEALVSGLAPETVLTHHGSDLNVDHRVAFAAVLTATRPKPGHPVKEVMAFEVASSTEWGFQAIEPVFRGNCFVDVTSTLARKVEALRAYTTEICDFPHPRSAEAVEAMARRWGSVVGCAAAEAFQLVRIMR